MELKNKALFKESCFVGGKWIDSDSGEKIKVDNPANNEIIGEVPKCSTSETTKAIKQSCEDQKKGITTFIEVILNQELGEPFRRDAMKKPVSVAGIKREDMKPQKTAT